ncbi:MAG: tetratricopeptide repeat protein [Magnetovibrio sp.]|nr:tetratricopeptide repeat protein [Magnetovibrio sp.]
MNRAERRQQKKLAKKAAKKGGGVTPPTISPTVYDQMVAKLQNGLQLHQQGDLARAKALYMEVLEIDEHQVDANHLLGLIAHQQGDSEKAVGLIAKALAVKPDIPDALNNYGSALLALKRNDEAIDAFLQALSYSPQHIDAQFNLGHAYQMQGQLELADGAYVKVLQLNALHPKALLNRACLLRDLGRYDEAIACCQTIIDADPTVSDAHNNLGSIYVLEERWEDACSSFAQAIASDPNNADALSNMGCVMREMHRYDDAIKLFHQAIAINPNMANAYSSLADSLMATGEYGRAGEALNKAISLAPDHTDAHVNMGILQLLQGNYVLGWKHYQWRRGGTEKSLLSRTYSQPMWDGQAFEGRTIYIYPEQGGGDYIQFLRFVPDVVALGGHVILEVPEPFSALVAGELTGVEQIVSGAPLPTFDCHASIMELPALMNLDINGFSNCGVYLHPQTDIEEAWRGHLGAQEGIRVGLVWSGNPDHKNDHNRSIRADLLKPLTSVDGVSLFSFQVGERAVDVKSIGETVVELSERFSNYAETAGALSQMDLVISVDTSVVHLAGAMGVPTWVLLPKVPDWRWMLKREDSPWYSSVRLFRQSDAGDWSGVMEHVVAELTSLVESKT